MSDTPNHNSLGVLLKSSLSLSTFSIWNRDRREEAVELFPSAQVQRFPQLLVSALEDVPVLSGEAQDIISGRQEAYVLLWDFFPLFQILWRRCVQKLIQVQK